MVQNILRIDGANAILRLIDTTPLIMADLPDATANASPQRFPKRNLPDSLASAYLHGLISGQPRSAQSQRSFDARKAIILRTMNAEQIESTYTETAKKINSILEEDRKKNEEIDREVQKLSDQRQLERKLWQKQKDEKAVKEGKNGAGIIKDEEEVDGLGLRM